MCRGYPSSFNHLPCLEIERPPVESGREHVVRELFFGLHEGVRGRPLL